jgi:hypothetical protein
MREELLAALENPHFTVLRLATLRLLLFKIPRASPNVELLIGPSRLSFSPESREIRKKAFPLAIAVSLEFTLFEVFSAVIILLVGSYHSTDNKYHELAPHAFLSSRQKSGFAKTYFFPSETKTSLMSCKTPGYVHEDFRGKLGAEP